MIEPITLERSFGDDDFADFGPLGLSANTAIKQIELEQVDLELVDSELRRYLPTILRSIEKWSSRESSAKDVTQRSLVSRQMTNCIEDFVSSGGRSRVDKPAKLPASHLLTGLYSQIVLDLFPLMEENLLKPICGMTETSRPVSPREHKLALKLYAFDILTDYLEELSLIHI